MVRTLARSVSGQVYEWIREGRSDGRVLAVHSCACNWVTDQGEVLALVSPEIGDGPLNVVLGVWPMPLSSVQAGTRVTYGSGRVVLPTSGSVGNGVCSGSVQVDLRTAAVWEPCPDWGELRARSSVIAASLSSLAALCLDDGSGNPLLSLLGAPSPEQGRAAIAVERFREAAVQIEAGWQGDPSALVEGGAALAGLGDGLTPAGDDFLVGVMLWAWLAHPTPRRFCQILAQAAAPRTTTLSAAFLRAAARGQCSAAWHRLLGALARGEAEAGRSGGQVPGTCLCSTPVGRAGSRLLSSGAGGASAWHLERAAQGVLAQGASSGLDAAIGFLWLSGLDGRS